MMNPQSKPQHTIFISSDDGKFYKITEKDLAGCEVHSDLEGLKEMRNRGVAYAGIEGVGDGNDGALGWGWGEGQGRVHFVNLAHTVPAKKV